VQVEVISHISSIGWAWACNMLLFVNREYKMELRLLIPQNWLIQTENQLAFKVSVDFQFKVMVFFQILTNK